MSTAMTTLMTTTTAMEALGNLTTQGVVDSTGSTSMEDFYTTYGQIHGYICDVVCVFGVISNVLNVIVLTRKHMISPTNCILSALAIADMLTMLTYLIYATYFYIATAPVWDQNHSKGWMYFIMIHNHFIITCHTMAMWLTVSLAVFRYIFVCHHVLANRLCSMERAVLNIVIIVVATIVICVPNYFMYKVVSLDPKPGYWIVDSDFVENNKIYKVIVFWIFGVIMKVAPCILLTLLSTMIILAMHRASRRRVRLLSQTRSSDHDVNSEHNRTTWMLIAVVLFFVITEFPQGILAMISGLNDDFFTKVYSNLGDMMDLLVLLNSAVNFVLYCIMSQQFRDTFRNLFVGEWLRYYKHGKVKGNQNGVSSYSTVKTEVTMV